MIDSLGRWYPDYPGQQPYMDPQYMRMGRAQQMQQPVMTPPTIHAEIVQVEGEAAAEQYPVGAGQSQMMMARDDSAIFVKTAGQNGEVNLEVYMRRPKAPPKPAFDPSVYVTREELQQILAGLRKEETE